eukprot:CAMPEP_0169485762 /NCGR_PEP_ID=MMETSP1042-20121227/32464_1 /TAXON_ID=464988 /ORGANISM="Hemiselmis andersenii, Strain CCMP1180" /LENGTH=48 /DNA_ID= /DNA_START= /DNA_END= /DNA_ORIENTATION=
MTSPNSSLSSNGNGRECLLFRASHRSLLVFMSLILMISTPNTMAFNPG